MPGRLTLHPARRPPRRWLLFEERCYELGRDDECELVVEDDRVSRRHARFRFAEDGWRIVDLASKNGVAVNGLAQAEAPLAAGAWLSIGGVVGSFELVEAGAARRESEARTGRWASSAEHHRRLDPRLGLDALLAQILDSVKAISGAERAFVLLAHGSRLEVAAAAGLDADALLAAEFSGSVGAVERALGERAAVAVADALGDPLLAGRPSIRAGGIRAVVCAPLVALDRLLGAVYADSRAPGAIFEELDVELLEAFAGHAALAIELARLDGELGRLAGELPSLCAEPARASDAIARRLDEARGRAPEAPPAGGRAPRMSWSDVLAAHSGERS
jgi:hypothetical protein